MNLLYLHTHDSGRMLGPYGYDVPTPALKRLASDALLFRQAYCVSPTCSPSRSSLLSGVYPHQNGMLGLAQRGFGMDMKQHLVQLLKAHGYRSVLCGIQHEAGYFLEHKQGSKAIGYEEDISEDTSGYAQEELTLWDRKNAEHMVKWLSEYQDTKPFFASYGMFATHRRYPAVDEHIDPNQVCPPYPAPDTPQTRLDHAGYLSSAKSADACVDLILNALKEAKLYEDTIILYTTDHGLANPFSKCNLFDSGIGVAMIMRVPGTKANGHVCDEQVSHLDVVPTLCDLLQLDKPSYLEGQSFAPVFLDPQAKVGHDIFAEVTFHTSYEPIRCIRTKRYKLIRYYDLDYLGINYSNIDESLTKDFFMDHGLSTRRKMQEALYDVYYDPGERNNLIAQEDMQAVLAKLRQKLDQHLKDTADPILQGSITIQNSWKVNRKDCLQASSKNPEDYDH